MADYTLSAKITGDATGFEKAFKTAEATATAFSEKMKNIGSKLSGIGSKLTSSITKPALAATSALAGITLVKGWNRMTQIDAARVKLEALGNSAKEVDAIMDNALASVKGTAYGMDEAATTAANAVAAGIQPGKELERYLKNVADAAAVTGADMSEMGSIFNKCATTNAAYNEELQQLSDRGLPIYTWLAEAAGVSAAEIKKMASQGEISCADLQNAIETHIDGAAKTIGSKTITGALSNISAAISRIGANFLGSSNDASSFAGKVLPALNNITAYLGTVEEKAKEWGAVFGEVFGALTEYCRTGSVGISGLSSSAAGIVNRLTPIIGTVQNLINSFSKLSASSKLGLVAGVVAAGPLISTLGKVMKTVGALSKVFGGVKSSISALVGGFNPILLVIAAVAAAFTYLMTTNEEFRNSIMNMVGSLGTALQPVLTQLIGICMQLVTMLTPVIEMLMSSLVPILVQIVSVLSILLSGLLPPLMQIIQSIMPLIGVIIDTLMTVIPPILSIVNIAIAAVADIIAGLMPIIDTVAQIITTVMGIVTPIVSDIAYIVSAIIAVVAPLVGAIVGTFGDILAGISQIMSTIGMVVGAVFTGIKNAWSGLTGFVQGVFSGIDGAVSSLVDSVRGFVNGVIGGINAAIGIINKIPGVSISKIPQLAHGTDNWQGGFAYMNEGGRGELTYLPNGAQIIPHDISVQYAKEAARASSGIGNIDLSGFMEGMIISISNNTSVDGTPLKEMVSDYTIQKIGNQQKAVNISKGAYLK